MPNKTFYLKPDNEDAWEKSGKGPWINELLEKAIQIEIEKRKK